MKVTFYQPKSHISIERVFADVRSALPNQINSKVALSRFSSRGIFRRVYNIVEAIFRQGDVNHITGDVHFLAYFLCGKKTLLTIHDLVSVHRLKGWRRSVLLFCWYWLPVRRAALISVISEFTKKDLLEHISVNPQKVRVVYDPVSTDFQRSVKEFNSMKPTILQIGTRPNKNIERIAHALHRVPCHLRVVGSLSNIQITILQRYNIEYSTISNISGAEIVEEYRKCDIVVFVSTFEGFGLPIVEAQATGRVVITSNVCSMPEVAGNAACLVNPFDVASIREGILKVIGDIDYRSELVRCGFENVKRFHPKEIAMKYAEIYRELIAE